MPSTNPREKVAPNVYRRRIRWPDGQLDYAWYVRVPKPGRPGETVMRTVPGARGRACRSRAETYRAEIITNGIPAAAARNAYAQGARTPASAASPAAIAAPGAGAHAATSGPTFGEVADLWIARREREDLAPSTMTTYRGAVKSHLKPAFGARPIASITADDLGAWVAAQIDAGHSAHSTRGRWSALRMIFAFAVRRNMLRESPVGLMERSERPSHPRGDVRVLNARQRTAVIKAARPGWERLFVHLAIFSGLRLGEMLGLRWEDIDFDDRVIHVRTQIDRYGARAPKTEAGTRRVILADALADALREHRDTRPSTVDARGSNVVRLPGRAARRGPKDPVFASMVGTPLDRKRVSKAWKQALERAGLDHVVLHTARHTFASMLIEAGQEAVFVAQQLGHASPVTTYRVYGHLINERRHADVAREHLNAQFGDPA